MGLSILKYLWFLFALASGLVAVLLGSLQYGVKIDLAAWVRISNDIVNEIPVLVKSPMIESYGFYGGVVIFLIFLILFVNASRAGRNISSEPEDTFDTSTDDSVEVPTSVPDDSEPDPGYLADSKLETESFDQPPELLPFETDNPVSEIGSTGESVEYASEEEWIETLQKFKDREA